MNRRDIIKSIAALPVLGAIGHCSNAIQVNERKAPRHLLQVGFTSGQIQMLCGTHLASLDGILKFNGLIPEDSVLEVIFDLATQDAYIYRWRHKDFFPVIGFEVISTRAVSDEWERELGCGR